jgi:transcriptional regulator with XRE-family HTH domain
MQHRKSVREFMRDRREELQLTQADVAQGVGVSSGDFISLVEKGMRNLDLDRIPRLAGILKTDPEDLCRRVIEEQYPLLAQCLFGATLRSRKPIGEVEVAMERFKSLPRHVRSMVISMITVLFEKEVVAPGRETAAA